MMNSDYKWLIMMCMVFGAMFAGLAYEASSKKECRIELAKAGKSAEDIVKVCGK